MHRRLRAALLAVLSLVVVLAPATVAADGQFQEYYSRGQVVEILGDGGESQTLQVRLLSGDRKGTVVEAQAVNVGARTDIQTATYKKGEVVVIATDSSSPGYSVVDHYRLPTALYLLLLVVVLAVVFAGWRGLGSLVGLGISLLVVAGFVLPQILHGANSVFIVFLGCLVIATLGIYFAHGFSRRTTIALGSTYIALALALGLSTAAVQLLQLNGRASEDVSYLFHELLPNLSLQGLLMGGIMIGVLGVLDDITVGQAAAVDELRKANAELSWRELYRRGLSVGREHIASLINTLVLAYVGTSFVFIVYVTGALKLPVWMVLNSELVMEEVVRSLVGSMALILAVPIATGLAAYFLTHSVRKLGARWRA